MLELIAIVMAGASILGIVALAARLRALEDRQREIEARPSMALPEPIVDRPLAGLSISLRIEQDHPNAPFTDLLRREFEKEDAAVVASNEDVVIRGALACNGYADIYFTADISCYRNGEAICTVVERPPHGDRPINLATEIIARLKCEIKKIEEHSERHQAIKELKSS